DDVLDVVDSLPVPAHAYAGRAVSAFAGAGLVPITNTGQLGRGRVHDGEPVPFEAVAFGRAGRALVLAVPGEGADVLAQLLQGLAAVPLRAERLAGLATQRVRLTSRKPQEGVVEVSLGLRLGQSRQPKNLPLAALFQQQPAGEVVLVPAGLHQDN